ncbi:hypothetical protein VMCG_05203 [Cytospora schulzeri]|uniref:Uncharacterized protein n=1 Tax=Cytospora schulzeri TaxID=448051 RepID=A0A423WQM4_9PEZI|nr:hypothetical protein VMCG_05203 [Valsa malicola]
MWSLSATLSGFFLITLGHQSPSFPIPQDRFPRIQNTTASAAESKPQNPGEIYQVEPGDEYGDESRVPTTTTTLVFTVRRLACFAMPISRAIVAQKPPPSSSPDAFTPMQTVHNNPLGRMSADLLLT